MVRWRSAGAARRVVALVRTATMRLVTVDEALIGEAIAVADADELTVYDAAYVAAARRLGATLVSGDLADLVAPGHALAPDAVP